MVNQLFKGEKLTRTKVKNNIIKIWNLTSSEDRFDWYQDANNYAHDVTIDNFAFNELSLPQDKKHSIMCGVIAALSPVKTWDQNMKVALDMYVSGEAGHMKQFVNKALKIMNCDGSDEAILSILNGRKISSFYLNIKYPNKANNVTIDRHALSIALGRWTTEEDYRGMTANQYEFFVQCYVLAAMQLGVSPLLVQSATWVKWRQIKTEY